MRPRNPSSLFLGIPLVPWLRKISRRGSLEFFEKKIRPVLAEHCYKCHSSDSKKLKASLYHLDTRAGFLKGGDTGPAIVPGDPEKSLLIEVIRYTDTDMEMPPKSKLPDAVIADFETWVKNRSSLAGRRSFRGQTQRQSPSTSQNASRSIGAGSLSLQLPGLQASSMISLAKRLKDAKLRPAPHAEPVTLLRRLTFDLTGLPPTVEEIERLRERHCYRSRYSHRVNRRSPPRLPSLRRTLGSSLARPYALC